ncbi:bifunctional endoribonuclease/protein kinase ire1 [Oleoguttula sp. CCFEE 5521]
MPPGRPSGPAVNFRLRDVIIWTLLLPAFATALQQQSQHAYPSPSAPLDASAATAQRRYDEAADSLNTRMSEHRSFRDTFPDKARTTHSERALATLSPAESDPAVRAPPAPRSLAATAGLGPRHLARSLQDWQVEDIILLATVDGSIHARDRTNFAHRWQLESDEPMVETVYHRNNKSVDEFGVVHEDPLWIVEPSQDGSIYMYSPGSGVKGMQRLGFTVKELADLSPYSSEGNPAFAYTMEKKTALYTVDARTGHVLKYFSSSGSMANTDQSCRRSNPLEATDGEECQSVGKLMLGRTEYTIGVQDANTGDQISTIKYFEWVPNTRDQDLQRMYKSTLDNKYVYTRHDGTVFRPARSTDNRPASLHHKFSSPVARVFDVIRPNEEEPQDVPLIVLPQPVPPRIGDALDDDMPPSVFVNCTESGSWYALSDDNYPEITHEAPFASCYERAALPGLPLAKREMKRFVGVHPLEKYEQVASTPAIGAGNYLGLDAPPRKIETVTDLVPPGQPARSDQPSPWIVVLSLLILLIAGSAGWKYRQLISGHIPFLVGTPVAANGDIAISGTVNSAVGTPEKHLIRNEEPAQETIFISSRDRADTGIGTPVPVEDGDDFEPVDADDGSPPPAEALDDNGAPKKRKAHRGRRGGKKQKEKEADPQARQQNFQLVTLPSTEVISVKESESLQIAGALQINSLVIHTDKVIGEGGCGTSVFEGAFGGRAVAVKRMLSRYFELASQEVSFLQQSDDHENVIRYYCQEKDNTFLYIALELCQASLFEIWEPEKAKTEERMLQLRTLKRDIQSDIPRNLKQLAKGVQHLHKLRIIHRDIKPQNILVAFPKSKYVDTGPRMVISDFGLGKNLPENVSTLIDPTGNAGTLGWKAPELISKTRETDSNHSQMSVGSESGTNGAGVKRAADIFSLGCLFFWMLTDGVHPYEDEDDNSWMPMRELNIKRDRKRLDVLQRWSDAYEPLQLITSMLEHAPENRPTALQVLNHPFFWTAETRLAFLCDVSDHFEREPRGTYEDYYAGDSLSLQILQSRARKVIGNGNNFLAKLDRSFVDTLGKQRKYSGDRLLDLLRALRNKKNHYEDMPEDVKKRVGSLPGGYLTYWTNKFPLLLMACYEVVHECGVEGGRFKGYLEGSA